MGEGGRPGPNRAAQRVGHMVDPQLAGAELGKLPLDRRRCGRRAGAERFEQRGHGDVRFAADEHIDRRQALVVHAPAIVQVMIERHLDDLGGELAAAILEGAGDVEPIEADDHVGVRMASMASGASVVPPGAPACKGWSVGNAAAILRSVTTRAPRRSASTTRLFQASRSRDTRPARMTGCFAPRRRLAAALIAPASAALATLGMKRAVSIGATGSGSFISCNSTSRLT